MEFAEVCFGIRKKDVLVEMLKSRLSIQRGTAFKELESFAREKILWLTVAFITVAFINQ